MPREIDIAFGRNGKIDGICHNFFCQVAMNVIDLNPFTNVDSFYIGKSFFFPQSLINFFIISNSLSEILLCLFCCFILIVQAVQLNFLDILTDNRLIVAYRLDPNHLIFTV